MTEPRKRRKASWRELPAAEMAAHLLATPTISDGAWTSEPRLPRETRSDFVRRVLLGETLEPEPERLRLRPQSWPARITRTTFSTLMGATCDAAPESR
jgi:hypothetical protein